MCTTQNSRNERTVPNYRKLRRHYSLTQHLTPSGLSSQGLYYWGCYRNLSGVCGTNGSNRLMRISWFVAAVLKNVLGVSKNKTPNQTEKKKKWMHWAIGKVLWSSKSEVQGYVKFFRLFPWSKTIVRGLRDGTCCWACRHELCPLDPRSRKRKLTFTPAGCPHLPTPHSHE